MAPRRKSRLSNRKRNRLSNQKAVERSSDLVTETEKMPSIDQCETVQPAITALSNTLEMFDTFKPSSRDDKDSDSEESFHLPLLDDDESESKSVASNGKDSAGNTEETEDDILNKFETVNRDTPDQLDAKAEENILKDLDEDSDVDSKKNTMKFVDEKRLVSNVDIRRNEAEFGKYEECSTDAGEFMSKYELENRKERHENTEKIVVDERAIEEEDASDKILEQSENGVADAEETLENSVTTYENLNSDSLLNELEDSLKTTAKLNETVKNDEIPSISTKETRKKPSKCNDKPCATSLEAKSDNSNDSAKNQENEEDLLDISIIRDAEEDNACAIATAIADSTAMAETDKEPTSDKSDNDEQDEERSELPEMENEEDNETERMDFEEDATTLEENVVTTVPVSDSETKDNVSGNDDFKIPDIASVDDATPSKNDDKDDVVQSTDIVSVSKCEDVKSDEQIGTESAIVSVGCGEEQSEETTDVPDTETVLERTKKRQSTTQVDQEKQYKKARLIKSVSENKTETENDTPKFPKNDKLQILSSFWSFMQNRKMKTQLTRSDLEQFCIQKICESVMLKSSEGELHQKIKKQEKTIETLRKDLQQLTKQAKDLEIVNKKLMNELKQQNGNKKPLVPLKITRSVGLQVRLNTPSDIPPNRRRQLGNGSPAKQTTGATITSVTNNVRSRPIPLQNNAAVVRQVISSPPKQTQQSTTTPLLSQALQNRRSVTPTTSKRATPTVTPIRPKPTHQDSVKTPTANPGVIDLTDEDDKSMKTALMNGGTPVKMLNKNMASVMGPKTLSLNKVLTTKAVGTPTKTTTPTRSVTTLPQGVRLASGQMKNGSIAIPAISSSSGTPQLMYVLPTITSSAAGTQKVAFVNLQPSNGVLSSALNTVLPTKQPTNTVTLKTVNALRKHPAPLPTPPRPNADPTLKPILPKPHLTIRKTDNGIILQWKMPYNLDTYENIASYQLYAYQETNSAPNTEMWRKVGDVKALALPMACTLTQFADKNKYYFAVRSVDVHKRIGAFSDPEEISL